MAARDDDEERDTFHTPPSSPFADESAHVRFSSEVQRAAGDTPTVTPTSAQPPGLTSRSSSSPSSSSSPPPVPPPAAQSRDRGYSLRRSLFLRNSSNSRPPSERAAASPPPALPSPAAVSPFIVQSPRPEDDQGVELTYLASPDDVKKELGGTASLGTSTTLEEKLGASTGDAFEDDYVRRIAEKKRRENGPWSRRRKGFVQGFWQVKKRLFGPHDLQRSAEGRRIPLGPEGGEGLIDERSGKSYCNNAIRSSRYTAWNFLPRQLVAQFSKFANFYFLVISVLQMIPGLSTTGQYTTIIPLLFFVGLSISKEGYDDYRRYRMDKSENRRTTEVFSPNPDGSPGWKTVLWWKVRVGDVLKLQRDDWIPADVIVLRTTNPSHIAYIETMALDGETNLKSKQALKVIAEEVDTEEKLAAFRSELIVEDPNPDLYNFEGKIKVGEITKPLTSNQIVYRGSVLRNTAEMTGMVIFTGEESKIRMNANKNPRTKAPMIQNLINIIVGMVCCIVLFITCFNTVAYVVWKKHTEQKSWYLEDASVVTGKVWTSYIIMFNTLIPLSLYISLEIVKVGQFFLLHDPEMYHEETDTPFEPHTSTINEDCGQVSYIFSDKTGTLTDNTMVFRRMSVAGQAYLHDIDIQERLDEEVEKPKLKYRARRRGKDVELKRSSSKAARKSFGDIPVPKVLHRVSLDRRDSSQSWRSPLPSQPQLQRSTVDLMEYMNLNPHTFFARKARFFLLAMALCHTCLPEHEENGAISYQAASPDESALVKAAMELGYIVIDRSMDTITIKTFPSGAFSEPQTEVYEILEVIEFTSKRKRMSVLIRMPTGEIFVFCKGADTTILELLKLRDLATEKQRQVERRASIAQRHSIEARRMSMQARRSVGNGRTSVGGRPSIGGREPSFGGGRPSLGITRPSFGEPNRRHSQLYTGLGIIKDTDHDNLLKTKKDSMEMSSSDDASFLSPRRSASYAARHSFALGEQPRSPLMELEDPMLAVDEDLAQNDSKIFERCFAHVNHFATEGLRTLLYAHRRVEEPEYQQWKRIYADATTSLVDRQAMVERAAEIIEKDFELTGATAIEDKLQKGVPDTVERLQRAGIKMWMLTGDKRETAINIGHSCRLIKDYSTVTILDKSNGNLRSSIRIAIQAITAGDYAHSVVVVDGGTLSTIDADEVLQDMFFDLAVLTESVICCRASPAQKADLVKRIRTKVQKSVTLAIGDGANDIAMIQEAHVGVGITGKEGLQAARVSDYSFAQFRYLQRFLLVHGRWNYVRTCKYVAATFYKEMIFYITQAFYQYWNGYSGTSLYEPWTLSMYNTLFTSLAVIILGIFDQDLFATTLLAVPELYQRGIQNRQFKFRIYFGWSLLATLQAALNFWMVFALYSKILPKTDTGVFAMGVICFTNVVLIVHTKMQILEMQKKTIIPFLAMLATIALWWLWNLVLNFIYSGSSPIHNVKGGLTQRFGRDLNWWCTLLLVYVSCMSLDVIAQTVRVIVARNEVDAMREIEKRPDMMVKLELAAKSEEDGGVPVDVDLDGMVGRRPGTVQWKALLPNLGLWRVGGWWGRAKWKVGEVTGKRLSGGA